MIYKEQKGYCMFCNEPLAIHPADSPGFGVTVKCTHCKTISWYFSPPLKTSLTETI